MHRYFHYPHHFGDYRYCRKGYDGRSVYRQIGRRTRIRTQAGCTRRQTQQGLRAHGREPVQGKADAPRGADV